MSWYGSEQAVVIPPGPPPNWYRDPSGVDDLRWWDGYMWTPRVVTRGQVTDMAMPPPGTVVGGEVDTRAELPVQAGLVALCGRIVGISLSLGLGFGGSPMPPSIWSPWSWLPASEVQPARPPHEDAVLQPAR